eukprot:5412231-Pyramimonas_sp.AAC.1
MKSGPPEAQKTAEEFFNARLKTKSTQHTSSMFRHFAIRALGGPGSTKIEGQARLQFAIGPDPLAREVNARMAVVLADLRATQLAGSAPEGPLEDCSAGE